MLFCLPCWSTLLLMFIVQCVCYSTNKFVEHLSNSWRAREMTMIINLSELRVTLSVTATCHVGWSLCITLRKYTFQRMCFQHFTGRCFIGNLVDTVFSGNLSSTIHICFWRKYFSFAYAKKMQNRMQLWLCNNFYR